MPPTERESPGFSHGEDVKNGSERPDGLAPWPSFSRPRPCAKELICKSNDLQIARVL